MCVAAFGTAEPGGLVYIAVQLGSDIHYCSTLPDLRTSINDVVVEVGRVAAEWRARGCRISGVVSDSDALNATLVRTVCSIFTCCL